MRFMSAARDEFSDHPHALRTWLRSRLPWFLIRVGVAGFGRNRDSLVALHNWWNLDGVSSRCIFCGEEREGQLWRTSPYAGAVVWHDLANAEALRKHRDQ